MKARKDTAFTVELLGLFILLIMVITIISSVFVMSRAHSLQARQLTEAVILAESTAEAASAAKDNESLLDMSSDLDNCIGHAAKAFGSDDENGTCVVFAAKINNEADSSGNSFLVKVTREYNGTPDERADKGTYASDIIEVYDAGDKAADIGALDVSKLAEPVYTLNTGTYFGPESFAQKGGGS